MITARLSTQDRPEVWWKEDPTVRVRAAFPLSANSGTKDTAVVYIELEPGCALGRHTDSAEEILLVLQGTVEVSFGDEAALAAAGEMAVVPEMVPHGIRNTGTEPARIVGFFPRAHIRSEFDHAYEPIGQQVFEF